MAGFYVQDPEEYVFLAKGTEPDRERGLTENEAHAVVFETEAEAIAVRDRLDPYLGPLIVVARRSSSAPES